MASRKLARSYRGVVSVVLGAALGGTAGTAVEVADVEARAGLVGAVRLGSAATVLLALVVVGGLGGHVRAALAGTTRVWILVAGVAVAACQSAYFAAVSLTGVAIGTVVALGMTPVACGVLGRWWNGERVPTAWLAATGCAVGGCGLMLLSGAQGAVETGGVLLAATAGTCYAIYTVAIKRVLAAGREPLAVVAISLALGALCLSPVLASGVKPMLQPQGLLLAAWIGIVATALAYLLYVRGLQQVRAATAGTLGLTEPLTAVLLGVLLLDESLSPPELSGGALLLGGLMMAAIPWRRNETVTTTRPVVDA